MNRNGITNGTTGLEMPAVCPAVPPADGRTLGTLLVVAGAAVLLAGLWRRVRRRAPRVRPR